MKSLPSAPLTDEDFDIYVRMCAHDRRAKGKHRLSWAHWYDVADRRDAELMFERMGHWEWGRTPPHKWWFEDWPGPEGRSRTPFDGACYYWSSQ